MPPTVPEAKPPRPSASSHSAELCEGEDVLDPPGRADEEVAMRLDRIPPRDERLHRGRPALLEERHVADRGLERLGTGVDRPEDDLVLQWEVPTHDVGIVLDRLLPSRSTLESYGPV